MNEFDLSWLEVSDEEDKNFETIDLFDGRYKVNHKGLVIDTRYNNRFLKPTPNNGRWRYVLVDECGRSHKIVREKVILMGFSPMHTSLSIYKDHLTVIKRSGKDICNAKDLLWKIPACGVECRFKSGFYSIPGNRNLLVSRDYTFYNFKTNTKYTKSEKGSHGYPTLSNTKSPNDLAPTQLVHRLIALAFIPLIDIDDFFFINHKDGNKKNYDVSNLEWTSKRLNNEHAIQTGLRTDTLECTLVNVVTGERKLFPSQGAAAKFLGCVTGLINQARQQWLRFKYPKFAPWVPVFAEDPKFTPSEHYLTIMPNHVTLYYKLQKDDEIRWFKQRPSFEECGITRHDFSIRPRRLTNEPIKGWIVSSYLEHEVPAEVRKMSASAERTYGSAPTPIRVSDLMRGTVKQYSSTQEFADEIGVLKKTIQRIVNYNNGRYRHYLIEYIK